MERKVQSPSLTISCQGEINSPNYIKSSAPALPSPKNMLHFYFH